MGAGSVNDRRKAGPTNLSEEGDGHFSRIRRQMIPGRSPGESGEQGRIGKTAAAIASHNESGSRRCQGEWAGIAACAWPQMRDPAASHLLRLGDASTASTRSGGAAPSVSGVPGRFDGRPPPLDLVQNIVPAILPAGFGRRLETQMMNELLGERHTAACGRMVTSL